MELTKEMATETLEQGELNSCCERERLTIEMAIKALKESRPKGRWVIVSTFPIRWQCSVCKTDYERASNYCSHCGADMRGEE